MDKVCATCTTSCAVDQDRCPHCGDTEFLTALEYEELTDVSKISVHGGLTSQATGAGFSEDPDDERAAGTRVADNTGEPAQTDAVRPDQDPTQEPGHEATREGDPELTGEDQRELDDETDGTGEALPPAETDDTGTYTGDEQLSDAGRYADWNKTDLIGEAERRDPPVPTAGTKADILQRLLEDDARRENEPGA